MHNNPVFFVFYLLPVPPLAIEPEANVFGKDFLAKYNLGMPSNIQRMISSLIEKQILHKENDELAFADVFLPVWIKKKQSQAL